MFVQYFFDVLSKNVYFSQQLNIYSPQIQVHSIRINTRVHITQSIQLISFLPDRSGVSFVEPTQQDETSLEKSIPTPDLDTTASEDRVDFKIVVGGSTRGADVLVEGSSYVYSNFILFYNCIMFHSCN